MNRDFLMLLDETKSNWLKKACLVLFCSFSSSCDNHHESEIEQIIGTEFKGYYRLTANNKQFTQKAIQLLADLEKYNPDAFRSLAYTWQNEAINTCRGPVRTDSKVRKSDYDLLLSDQPNTTPSWYLTEQSIRPCVVNFYSDNWSRINSMIKLHFNYIE